MNFFQISPKLLCFERNHDLAFFDNKNFTVGNNYCKDDKLGNFYVVKPLDTFDLVSKKLGIEKETLKNRAGTKNLFVGQKIYLG